MNANNSETMSRKEAGAAKVQELEYKAEEVVMQVPIYLFVHLQFNPVRYGYCPLLYKLESKVA